MDTFVVDTVFVLSVVQFFKTRYDLRGDMPLLVAFVVILALLFVPDLLALVPQLAPYADKVILLVKLFLTAPGLFDFAVEMKSR